MSTARRKGPWKSSDKGKETAEQSETSCWTTIWFFSDEKNFCQYQKHNTQNNRWLAYSPKDTPCVMQTKFPQTVKVFGCVSSEGDVMPPHFFQRGYLVEFRYLRGVAKHCSQALHNKGSQWSVICMAAGFGPLAHLWEKSKMVVGDWQCLASELPRS